MGRESDHKTFRERVFPKNIKNAAESGNINYLMKLRWRLKRIINDILTWQKEVKGNNVTMKIEDRIQTIDDAIDIAVKTNSQIKHA